MAAFDLSNVERTAAELFFNVSVQSAFAKEDPNVRFAAAYNQKDMAGYQGAASMDDVERKVYQADVAGGTVALETNPDASPALSRVIMKGGRSGAVIDTVVDGFANAEYFSYSELASLPPAPGQAVPAGAGNRFFRLDINKDLNADHAIAVLFSWHAASDSDVTLECLAWPFDKTMDLTK